MSHLNSTCHATSLHLVDHSRCKESGIYVCCTHKCPSSPRRFFSSQRALDIHYNTHHKAPADTTPSATDATPLTIATSHIFTKSQRNNLNHWTHGLTFIDSTYDHEPPDFRTTWRQMLRGRQKAAFVTLQASIIRSIVVASTHTDDTSVAAPFWWLLLHLDMLIFAPSTKKQRDNLSIQHTIDDRIQAAFCGDIAFLFQSAMAVKRHTQNTRPSAHSMNRSAQLAADNDDYRTAVARACTSQTVASIGPSNIAHVHKLYTDPVPDRGYTHPAELPLHQRYPLPGDICKTIKIAAKNKGTGVNSDSIDLLTLLVKSKIPTVKDDLRYIFDIIFQNRLPPQIRRYFTDVYLFCLHKSPTDPSKLRPLGIPTAIRRIVASHVARTLKHKFASHLLPFNYAVGIPNGSSFVVKAMQLSIEKYITTPQTQGHLPSRAAIFFDLTNQFNSVSRQEFFHVIASHFPELLPLTLLFYDNPMTVHHKWNDGSWRQFLMREGVSQGCPLSPLFASFVVANLIKPIDSLLRDRAGARLASGDPGDDGFGGISHLLGYVDDISSCVYLPDLPFLCDTLKTNGDKLGCFINPSKTRILTSCIGVSPIPELYATNPSLATQITNTIARFSTDPHPTDRSLPPLPVELLSGFRLLGHPVGSASFAREFFTTCLAAVESDIASINDTIDDDQTKLRLFTQCTLQKIPHLLSSDVLYHLPTDIANPPWEEWNGPLTAATDTIISTFLSKLLQRDALPTHSTLISQLGLSHGGLGLLSPRTRAVPDFVLSMANAHRNATTGFALHPDSTPHLLHPTLRDLFEVTTNPDSDILRRFHILLPHFAAIGCAPSTPPADRLPHFLQTTSLRRARERITTFTSTHTLHSIYHDVCSNSPEHTHLLPSLLSPQTSYPIIALCRSKPGNRLPPWCFSLATKRKLRLPIFSDGDRRICRCGRRVDDYGDHIFQCPRLSKLNAHNILRDGLATILPPALAAAGYLLPTSTCDIEPNLHLPSDTNARPFDVSFHPDARLAPNVTQSCPFSTIGADITITSLPTSPTFPLSSPDVIQKLAANADSHLQLAEKRKLGRVNKRDPATTAPILGDAVIGDILQNNMVLLPFAFDPLGRFGPILRHFLLNSTPHQHLDFHPSRPNATKMYKRIMTFPCPKGILPLADHNWTHSRTREFFGHSYSSPTPSITTLQDIGLCLSKAFATHIRNATRKFGDRTPTVPRPYVSYPFLPTLITLARTLT